MMGFIDCEFNGWEGDLLSMAIVTDDAEFYETLNLQKDQWYDKWVSQNVMPIMNKDPIAKEMFQIKLWEFICKYDSIHIIADYPDDIKYFCQALLTGPGRHIGLPPKLTMQIDIELSAKKSKILHNALEDARAIRKSWYRREKENEGYGISKTFI